MDDNLVTFDSGRPPRAQQADRVRIGPISLFALVITICLAVLAVLVISTAHASFTLSERQAIAVTEQYLDEQAAWEFVALLDELLANGQAGGIDPSALPDLCGKARAATGGQISVEASVVGDAVYATFSGLQGRTLSIQLTLQNGGYRIDSWKLSAVQHEEQPEGQLLVLE